MSKAKSPDQLAAEVTSPIIEKKVKEPVAKAEHVEQAESKEELTKAPVFEPKLPGKIEQIIAHHKAGKTNDEIVKEGFNKTTVSIQVAKHKKKQTEIQD